MAGSQDASSGFDAYCGNRKVQIAVVCMVCSLPEMLRHAACMNCNFFKGNKLC